MNEVDKRKRIVSILRAEYERAAESYLRAHAERVGMDAAANAWDEFNPDDGVGSMSQNPHSGGQWSDREQSAKLYASQMRESYDLAVDTFIGTLAPEMLAAIQGALKIADLWRPNADTPREFLEESEALHLMFIKFEDIARRAGEVK